MVAPAVALVAAALVAPASPAVTVIDRTVSCEVGISGGIAKVNVLSFSALRTGPQRHDAEVDVRTKVVPAWRLAAVSESWLMLSPACRAVRATVPLSSRGLAGGKARLFGDLTGCPTTPRVLVRVRAFFSAATSLRSGSLEDGFGRSVRMLIARGTVTSGALAIRTTGGKPLVYGSVSGGKARVFKARSCS